MKTIGFIDYFIDEWHANNYVPMIENYNKIHNTDYVVKYVWAEKDGKNTTTAEWCEKFNAEKCDTICELCEKADYIMILAPSNPETHLKYAKEVFKYGKRVYVDKTFAPDYNIADAIFKLADEYGVKFFSSSALRYATELDSYLGSKSVSVIGGGGNFEEYLIHQLEIAVKCLGIGAEKVLYSSYHDQEFAEIVYKDGRHAFLTYAVWMPFAVIAQDKDGISKFSNLQSAFFDNLISDVLNFFETGDVSFDVNQTLEIMKIREAIIKAKKDKGQWIKL